MLTAGLNSLAIILPPLGVFLERGCNADFVRFLKLYICLRLTAASHHSSSTSSWYVLWLCLSLTLL
jgi:hypothetical protein